MHAFATLFVRPASLVALACTAAVFAAAAQNNTPLLRSSTIQHKVLPGDTLEHLALRYLGDASLWPALQKEKPSSKMLTNFV